MEAQEEDPKTGTEQEFITGIDDADRRLDRILRRALPDMPLSGIHRLLRKGRVRVDGLPAGAAERVKAFSRIRIAPESEKTGAGEKPARSIVPGTPPAGCVVPATPPAGNKRVSTARPEPGPEKPPALSILWEGAGLIILNKPAGLAVHGSGGEDGDNLNARLHSYLGDRLPPSLSFRPGPLHRLDQVSSGVIAFSLSLEGARSFSALMRERRLRKRYLALADGVLAEEAVWEDTLFRDKDLGKTFSAEPNDRNKAQAALTRVFPLAACRTCEFLHLKGAKIPDSGAAYGVCKVEFCDKSQNSPLDGLKPDKLLAVKEPYSLIALEIETGRTHQIRAQAALHGHPLAGDRKYGGSHLRGGLMLHALSLEFPPDAEILPPELRGKRISAPLPERFARQIEVIFGSCDFVVQEFTIHHELFV